MYHILCVVLPSVSLVASVTIPNGEKNSSAVTEKLTELLGCALLVHSKPRKKIQHVRH